MKKSFADILSSMQDDMARKVEAKIPSWKGMELPSSLSYEQCSSERTAAYKLRFVHEGDVVADLTGGLGVDSAAFASKASVVHYFEQNPELFAAVQRNFSRMAASSLPDAGQMLCDKILMRNETVSLTTDIPQCDLIYMDPARRSTAGKKVFLLEDCTPNVLELLPMLMQRSTRLLLKLSPMADISLVVKRLQEAGADVAEVHVVEAGGEVKELLVLIDREAAAGDIPVTATDLQSEFTFSMEQESRSTASFAVPAPGDMLFVPAGCIMKAGAYNSLALPRLSQHSHLYLSGPGAAPGRQYRIEEIHPFSSKAIKELSGRFRLADVSCHDVPLRSEELSARLRCKSGGDHHIFATSSTQGNLILITRKICQ